ASVASHLLDDVLGLGPHRGDDVQVGPHDSVHHLVVRRGNLTPRGERVPRARPSRRPVHLFQRTVFPAPCVAEAVDDEHVVSGLFRGPDRRRVGLRRERLQVQHVEIELVGVQRAAVILRVNDGDASARAGQALRNLQSRVGLAATARPDDANASLALFPNCTLENELHQLSTSTLTSNVSPACSATTTPGMTSPVSASMTVRPSGAMVMRCLMTLHAGSSLTRTSDASPVPLAHARSWSLSRSNLGCVARTASTPCGNGYDLRLPKAPDSRRVSK